MKTNPIDEKRIKLAAQAIYQSFLDEGGYVTAPKMADGHRNLDAVTLDCCFSLLDAAKAALKAVD